MSVRKRVEKLGRPLKYFILSLASLMRDHVYSHFSMASGANPKSGKFVL